MTPDRVPPSRAAAPSRCSTGTRPDENVVRTRSASDAVSPPAPPTSTSTGRGGESPTAASAAPTWAMSWACTPSAVLAPSKRMVKAVLPGLPQRSPSTSTSVAEEAREVLGRDVAGRRLPHSHQVGDVCDGVQLLDVLGTDVAQAHGVQPGSRQLDVVPDVAEQPLVEHPRAG